MWYVRPGWLWMVALVACSGPDKEQTHSGTPTEPIVYTAVAEGLPGALLSVSGTAADDVWAVGADRGGAGPLVLQWDGAAWTSHDVGSPGDLWWSWRAGADERWIAGAGGRIVRYTPSAGTSVVDVPDPDVTFFGLWGSGPDDVYAVGGNLTQPTGGAAVLRYDGSAWTSVALPAAAAATIAMYKVWGTSADDVWVCGLSGIVLHWDGADWTQVPTGTTQPLFTIAGSSSDDVWAVGGAGNGIALHWDGSSFVDRSPAFVETLQGVVVGADGAVVVGWGGRVFSGDADALVEDPRGRATVEDLHAVWVDPDGGWWMVGGDLGGATLTAGTLIYSGAEPPAAFVP
jgi:hypothetical protein